MHRIYRLFRCWISCRITPPSPWTVWAGGFQLSTATVETVAKTGSGQALKINGSTRGTDTVKAFYNTVSDYDSVTVSYDFYVASGGYLISQIYGWDTSTNSFSPEYFQAYDAKNTKGNTVDIFVIDGLATAANCGNVTADAWHNISIEINTADNSSSWTIDGVPSANCSDITDQSPTTVMQMGGILFKDIAETDFGGIFWLDNVCIMDTGVK